MSRTSFRHIAVLLAILVTTPVALAARAAEGDPFQAQLTLAEKRVDWQRNGTRVWQRALVDTLLMGGDALRTGEASKAELLYGDGSVTRVGSLTTLTLTGDKRREMRLDSGTVLLNIRKGGAGMRVITPGAVAAVTGTELMVAFDAEKRTTEVTVFEGAVNVTGDVGELVKVLAGTTTRVLPNAPALAPVPLDNGKLQQRHNLYRALTLDSQPSSAPNTVDTGSSVAPTTSGSAAPTHTGTTGASASAAPTTPTGTTTGADGTVKPDLKNQTINNQDPRFMSGSPTTGRVRVIIE